MADNGTCYWNELPTPDPDKSKAFYGEVVGWTSREMQIAGGAAPYTIWQAGGKDVGGMLKMEDPQFEGVPPHWIACIAVDDVDAACGKVEGLGDNVNVPPRGVPEIGRFCVVSDPAGAAIALMKPAPR